MWARNIKIDEIGLYEEFHWVANSLQGTNGLCKKE